MLDFIERLKAKPHHVRQRIAMGTSVGVTGVVAAGWLLTLVFSGHLTLNSAPASTGGTGSDVSTAVSQTSTSFNQLLGAAGLATATTAPASLTIVDAPAPDSSPKPERNSQGQTVIPF